MLWFGVYNVALNAAERRIDAGTAAMLVQIGPIIVALLAAVFLGEALTRWLLIGALVGFGGVAVIGLSSSGHATGDLGGVLLAVLAAVTYGAGVVTQKPLLSRLPGLEVTFLACVIGAVVCLPFAGDLVESTRTASTQTAAPGRLPGRLPDGDRLLDLGVGAVAHQRREPGPDDVPRAGHRHRARVAVPRRAAGPRRVRRWGAVRGRRGAVTAPEPPPVRRRTPTTAAAERVPA